MTEDTNANISDVSANKSVEVKKNRKQRRFEAKLARRAKKEYQDTSTSYWVKRFVTEMKENPAVQERVTSGKLDKYLG